MELHDRSSTRLRSPLPAHLSTQQDDAPPSTIVVLLSSVQHARQACLGLTSKIGHLLSHLTSSIGICSDLEVDACAPGGTTLTASVRRSSSDARASANLLLALHAKAEISQFLDVVGILDQLLHLLAREIENAPREMQLSREAMTDLRCIAEAYALVFAMAGLCCAWAEISISLAESHKLLLGGSTASSGIKCPPCDSCGGIPPDRCIVSVRIMESWSLSPSTSTMLTRFPSLRSLIHAVHSVRSTVNKAIGSSPWMAVAGKLVATGCLVAVASMAAAYASKVTFGASLHSAAKAVCDAEELAGYKEQMLRQWDSAAIDIMSRSLPRPAALQTGDMVVALPRETLLAETLRVQRMACDARQSLSALRTTSVAFGTAAGIVSAALEQAVAAECSKFSDQAALKLKTSFSEQLASISSGVKAAMRSSSTEDDSCTGAQSTKPAVTAHRTVVGALSRLISCPGTVEQRIGDVEHLNRRLACLQESLADIAGFWRHALAASFAVDGFRDASGGLCTFTSTDPADSQLLARLDDLLTSQGFGIDKPVIRYRTPGSAAADTRRRDGVAVLELLHPAPYVRWQRVHLAAQHGPIVLRPWFIWETACQSCTEPFSPATSLTGDGADTGGADLLSVALCHRRHVMCSTCGVRWLRAGRSRSRHNVPELQRRADSAFHEVFAEVGAWLRGHDTAVLTDASAPCPCCRRIITTRPMAMASPFVRTAPGTNEQELQHDLKNFSVEDEKEPE